MKITILVEGKTEGACKAILVSFLKDRLQGVMPRLSFAVYDGRIPMGESLRRRVAVELEEPNASDYVIALTDVGNMGRNRTAILSARSFVRFRGVVDTVLGGYTDFGRTQSKVARQ
jgi:hypothetical protein